MSDKNRLKQQSGTDKKDDKKQQGGQPLPEIGQKIPYDKGRANTKNNPAGQGNEGEDVMPAGRETPG